MPAGFLARLGIVGWAPLEPVVLAALATESPVLLVGEHGTAKSLLVERLAGALGLVFRHYNASLVSYDDLVGIPLPDDHGPGLRFVGTQGAIWGAGFVFLDEISRCRPELQNKLFPLIHASCAPKSLASPKTARPSPVRRSVSARTSTISNRPSFRFVRKT